MSNLNFSHQLVCQVYTRSMLMTQEPHADRIIFITVTSSKASMASLVFS